MSKTAIQDTYGQRFKHCWGCGADNEQGLHLKSYPTEDGSKTVCTVIPDERYTGGVPHNLFGGMIATIFDCHGTASAAYFSHHDRGLELSEDTVIDRFITARLEIDFKKPVPMGENVVVTAIPEEIKEKKVIVLMEMEAAGEIRAQARMVAVKAKTN